MKSPVLPVLLAALCEALAADLDIEELSLLLLVAHRGSIPARKLVGHNYRRPREGLRRAGLLQWVDGSAVLTPSGDTLAKRIVAATPAEEPAHA